MIVNSRFQSPVMITLTTDFAKQSQGVAMLEAVIAEIAPRARVIHYMHGLDDYDTLSAARVLETVQFIMPGIHVCVCDPGVGTARRSLAILTRRGDVLIGPDNGVLLPACTTLGEAEEIREITNTAIMRQPVSAVFHGRDVFAPAAAHLANGLSFELLGEIIEAPTLVSPPYDDAEYVRGRWSARIVHIDKFGNSHLNIRRDEWSAFAPPDGRTVTVALAGGRSVAVEHHVTFGVVAPGTPLLVADNDGRPALAIYRGNFAAIYGVRVGDDIVVECATPPTND
jgi:S-adenosylmethionine hydrolase